MLRKPCAVRKRSISSSGLIPASTRRKTLRISASSNTTELFDCSEETSRTAPSSRPRAEKSSAGLNSAITLRALEGQAGPHRADELPRDPRVLREAVEGGAFVVARDEQLVEVVRSRVEAHLDEGERQLRLGLPDRTVSSTWECETVRDFAPYQRCRVTYSISDRSSISPPALRA